VALVLGENALVHIDSLCSDAVLTAIDKDAAEGDFGGMFQIGVLQHWIQRMRAEQRRRRRRERA